MWKEKSDYNIRNERGGKRCRWDSKNSMRRKGAIIPNKNQENYVCFSSREQQVVSTHTCSHYLHTAGWNIWTQRHAGSPVRFLDQCVTACSPEKHTPNEHTPDQQEHTLDCWGDTLRPSNVTTAREEATCVNTGREPVDPNYTVDLCYSQGKNWGLFFFNHSVIWS